MDTDGATPPVHPLLARQLRRVGLALPGTPTPEQWTELVSRVSSAYEDGDRQRYIFERSLNIATREMDELTERLRQASEAAHRERDRLAAILGGLGDGVIALGHDGTVQSANPEALELLGCETEALVGAPLWEAARIVEIEDGLGRWTREVVQRAIVGGAMQRSGVVRVTPRSGAVFVADVVIRPLDALSGAAAVMVFRDVTERWQAERERRALQKLNRAVAEGLEVDLLLDSVVTELGTMLGADAVVCRLEGGILRVQAGTAGEWERGTVVADTDGWTTAAIEVSGAPWGMLLTAPSGRFELPVDARDRIARFADLIALAVANARARESLVALATTDPLTGLANQRAFHDRLAEEVARAERHGWPLSLVLLDIDHFKQVNDVHGHPVGNVVLAEVARRLGRGTRQGGDCLARIGGEEFAWLMPQSDLVEALDAAERARVAMSRAPFAGVGTLTVSLGVCDLATAGNAADLVGFADAALYWAKRLGRNAAFPYVTRIATLTDVMAAPPGRGVKVTDTLAEFAHRTGLGDAFLTHCGNVAGLTDRLAEALGWSSGRRARLRDAALLHDLGGVGVPGLDCSYVDPGSGWSGLVHAHALAGAGAAGAVLDTEQARWVRGRTEHWDGGGGPDRLVGDMIPAGSLIIAAADTWETLVTPAPYGGGMGPDQALDVCRMESGRVLAPAIVGALHTSVASHLPVRAGAAPG